LELTAFAYCSDLFGSLKLQVLTSEVKRNSVSGQLKMYLTVCENYVAFSIMR